MKRGISNFLMIIIVFLVFSIYVSSAGGGGGGGSSGFGSDAQRRLHLPPQDVAKNVLHDLAVEQVDRL